MVATSGSAYNKYEVLFKTLCEIGTCWIWAYVINKVGLILD
jgi:hypothetical protein